MSEITSITVNGREIEEPLIEETGAACAFILGHAYHVAEHRGLDISDEDLTNLKDHLESLEIWINRSLKSLGCMLSVMNLYKSVDELNSRTVSDLGTLIEGLSDLQNYASATRWRLRRAELKDEEAEKD